MPATRNQIIDARFARLEDRVFKLELRLGPEAVVAPTEPPPLPPPIPLPAPLSTPTPTPTPTSVTVEPKPIFPPAVAAVSIPYEAAKPIAPSAQTALEQTIGLKWTGWAGAVVLVIGAAFGVKFVYDQHWFGQVPPALWLSAIFLAGLSLIGIGEVIYRRVHVIPAASVFGAGVGTLFLAGYVGNSYYELYSPSCALFLMALATLIGALVAMRGNLVSIAVLSLLGANIAPLLVQRVDAPLESFLIYLLAMQIVALRLASWGRGKKWWTLRALSLASTGLWVLGTGLRPGHEQMVLLFAAIYTTLYHGELIVTAMRSGIDETSSIATSSIAGPDGITFTLLVTAAFTGVLLWVTRDLPPGLRGAATLSLATISFAVGWGLSLSKARASIAIRNIGVAHRVAAAALLALTIPVALAGVQTEIGWGVLALALAAAGAVTGSKIARAAGVISWILALSHLAIADVLPIGLGGHPAVVCFHLFGTAVSQGAVLGFVLSILGQVIAVLSVSEKSKSNSLALLLSTSATVVWVITSLISLPALAATAWIVEYAWLLVAADTIVPRMQLSRQAMTLIGFAIFKWALHDTLMDRLRDDWSASIYRPMLNPSMAIGALLAASQATLYALRRQALWPRLQRAIDSIGGLIIPISIGVLILGYGFSFEIDRFFQQMQSAGTLRWPVWQATQLGWTIAWSLGAAGLFAVISMRDANDTSADWLAASLRVFIQLIALKYLTLETTAWRLLALPANVHVVANLESIAAAIVIGSLIVVSAIAGEQKTKSNGLSHLLICLVLLWMGTIEIDRFFTAAHIFAGAVRPEQVALSIFWSIFAVAVLLLGFNLRATTLRYFALALLAITLMKVVLIDMSQVQTGYRILSFMGLGGFLLWTSVLYGKFSPRLLREEPPEESQVSVN